jgi:hypothetical protein
MFSLDDRAEQLEKQKTSPKIPEMLEIELPRADRYASGGSLTSAISIAEREGKGLPVKPIPAAGMIGRYLDPKRARYARGRRYTITADEHDFEPVNKEEL